MNPLLENKLQELENAQDYECWYLVKQPTAFDNLCYLVSFLKDYILQNSSEKLQTFISKKIKEIKKQKPNLNISDNYRALRVAAFFGLITMPSSGYKDALITDTFEEINKRCDGEFENTDLYIDIIQRQIEKIHISSSIDEEYKGVRREYRLYPVMLLYKILLELGRSTGEYAISITEYRYLVATTKVYEDFLNTLLLIKLLREDKTAESKFEQYSRKFDNRFIQALKQLPTLNITSSKISIKETLLDEVCQKVFYYETNSEKYSEENYTKFLSSSESLFDGNNIKNKKAYTAIGENVILYGVPGAGKSWTIKNEYCTDDCVVERVVFHPDYTYSDFIGQILPLVNQDGKIEYKFTPGPFTNILRSAYDRKDKHHILIIEEINRGNAPAIFGEVFQLLDRVKEGTKSEYPIGSSEYSITNSDIAKEVYGVKKDKVRIPANLSIIGTMNTSDQNVFTLDTAFKRRWKMRSIPNNVDACRYASMSICKTNVTWAHFAKTINDKIIEIGDGNLSTEDNRLGAYFADESEIRDRKLFAEKVLMYLWNDAFKYDRESIFKPQYRTLEELIEGFNDALFDVFDDSFGFDSTLIQDEGNNDITVEQFLEDKNQGAVELYNSLYEKVTAIKPDIQAGATSNYIRFRPIDGKNCAEIHLRKSDDEIKLLTLEPRQDENKIGQLVPKEYNWPLDYQTFISRDNLDTAVALIIDTYEQNKNKNR